MLLPKKIKHRKVQRGSMAGIASRGTNIDFGKFALKCEEHGLLTSRQIEAARRAMTRYIRRGGKVFIRIFPDKPMSKTASDTPMGGGKGAPDHFVCVVRPGVILFEMDGVPKETAKEAMRLAAHKLPVSTKFWAKEEE